MDCRKSLVLALGLASGSLGCIGSLPWLRPAGDQRPEPVQVTREKDLPRRLPHASTCVAFGQYREKEAAFPDVPADQRQRMLEQARKAYQQALEIDPNYLPAYTCLARLYGTLGEQGRAVATFEKALKGHPKDASVWYEFGMCCSRQKKWDKALEKLRTAVKLDPENRQYAITLGFCLARTGRFEDSLACFTPLVGKAEAHYKVAQMAHHLKQDGPCKEYLRLALKEKPELADARNLLDQLEGRAPAPAGPATQAAENKNGAKGGPLEMRRRTPAKGNTPAEGEKVAKEATLQVPGK
jgi:tetratricopeptide (TPR) repeat protein